MIDESTRSRLKANWQAVQDEVSEAVDRYRRDPGSVSIIGVSKYVDVELTKALCDVGCSNLGESRPQSLWEKSAHFTDNGSVHWHMIGHLQRNKIRRTLPIAPLIHSVDSQRLLDAISEEAELQGRNVSVLLEVNISGDQAKTGLLRKELFEVMEQAPVAHVQIKGLMAMAGRGTDPIEAGKQFELVRQARDEIEQQFDHPLPELSMGMSGDFVQAITAGATMVRIGSRLFEGIVQR